METSPWWFANACIVTGSTCRLFRSDDSWLQLASDTVGSAAEHVYYSMAVLPVVLPFVSLILWLALCWLLSCVLPRATPECGWRRKVEERVESIEAEMADGRFRPSSYSLGSLYIEFLLLVMDIVSDINCIITFFAIENHPAAGIFSDSHLGFAGPIGALSDAALPAGRSLEGIQQVTKAGISHRRLHSHRPGGEGDKYTKTTAPQIGVAGFWLNPLHGLLLQLTQRRAWKRHCRVASNCPSFIETRASALANFRRV